jgi:ribosomal protein S18 acetylase RimI-like enzyme
VDVISLGYRTDLALLQLGGSTVEDRGDHLVVRSPHNPARWWGNFLLLRQVPALEDTQWWLDRFAAELPGAKHVALGVDGVAGKVSDLAAFSEQGLHVETATVMTATSVHEPPRPNREATYRRLVSDEDWARSVEVTLACKDDGLEPVSYREFAEHKGRTNRALAEAGHGGWFGAFVDGRLVSQMGLYIASPGLARFQSVETHPEFRGRGLAGSLVHHVSRYGFDELGARTLVMVADPDYLAIRVYRSVGFSGTESQLQAERPPMGARL